MEPRKPTLQARLNHIQHDLLMAASILTRLPVPDQPTPDRDTDENGDEDTRTDTGTDETHARHSFRFFPLVGVLVAGLSLIPALILSPIALPYTAVAVITLGLSILITGALHEDGLADLADGMGGKSPPERRQIMHDSRIGAFGVIALALCLVFHVALLAYLAQKGLTALVGGWVAASCLSRATMSLQSARHAPPEPSGFAHQVGQADLNSAFIAIAIGIGLAAAFTGIIPAILAAILAVAATAGLGLFMQKYLGGVNGDGLGATQQITSAIALLSIAAVA